MKNKKRFSCLAIALIFVLSTLFSTGINVFASEIKDSTKKSGDNEISEKLKEKEPEYALDHVIVRIKDNANLDIENTFKNQISIKEVKKLTNLKGKQKKLAKSDALNIVAITLKEKSKKDVLNAIAVLSKNPNIEYAEPDYMLKACLIPNDYYYANGSQSYLNNIAMPDAWSISTGSSSVVVGVIDTGIDYNHPDLQNNMWHNPGEIAGNGIDDDGNGYIDDVYGWNFVNDNNNPMDNHFHGTYCAGIIGATGNNSIGVAGISWNIKLAAIKAGDSSGYFSNSSIIAAINYSIIENIPILNNSYGGRVPSKAVYDAISNYSGLYIAAAGNNGMELSDFYPSGYDLENIISVAATDNNDQIASFSNYETCSVDIAAPGVNITSLVPNSSYETHGGTSAAAPHVTGAAALILSTYSGYSASQIKEAILKNCDLISGLSGKCLTGGRLNVYKALLDSNSGFTFDAVTQTITRYVGNASSLTVPPSIGGVTVKVIGENAFAYNNELQTVSIPSCIEIIDDYAFFACNALEQVTVDSSNQYYSSDNGVLLNKNGTLLLQFPHGKAGSYTIPPGVTDYSSYAFKGSGALTSITFNNALTTISDKLFESCSALSNISLVNISQIDSGAFINCSSLSNIVMPNVTEIGEQSFMNCISLVSITIPASLTNIGNNAFLCCCGLINLVIDSNSLLLGEYAFYFCTSLLNITINGFISQIEEAAFLGCTSLESVTIPFKAGNQTSIESDAFSSCASLSDVTLAKSVNSINDWAFDNCAPNIVISGCVNSAAETYAISKGFTFNAIEDPVITVTTDITTLRNQHLDVYVSVDHGTLVENCHTFYSNDSYTYYANDIVGNSSSLLVTVSNIIPKGDVNFDGIIAANDAQRAYRAAMGTLTLTLEQTLAADVDSDGVVTTTDSDLIMQYSTGQITSFPNP